MEGCEHREAWSIRIICAVRHYLRLKRLSVFGSFQTEHLCFLTCEIKDEFSLPTRTQNQSAIKDR